MAKFFSIVYQFINKGIWEAELEAAGRFKRFYFKHLRIIVLAFRNFFKDKCPLHASALTYYSMLAVVPVGALAFGISRGFGMQNAMKDKLLQELPEHAQVVEWVMSFAEDLLTVARSGLFASIGVLLLIWSAIRVLGNIEETLNAIWGVRRSRSFARKFSDYVTIMVIGPVIFFASSSLAVYITSQVTTLTKETDFLIVLHPVVFYLLKLTPLVLIWLLFTLTYMIIPNTRVKFGSAFYGAIFAGTLYQLVQLFYIEFQFGATKYSTIYGTFAALPLFLIWLQLSWFILLLGAELNFASQNLKSFLFEKESGKLSGYNKKLLALQIAYVIIKSFESGEDPITEKKISKISSVPERITGSIIKDLLKSKIINPIASERREEAYQPAIDINKLKVQDVLSAIEKEGTGLSDYSDSKMRQLFSDRLQKFDLTLQRNPQNVLLKDI